MKSIILVFIAAILMYQSAYTQNCGTTNIALTKNVTASSYLDQFSTPGNIVDGSTNTNWKSTSGTDQWIMIDLGQTYSICNVELAWSTAFTFATTYTVEVSATGTPGSGTYILNTTTSDGGTDQITPSTPVAGRYIRIHATVRAATWADKYELFEVVVNAGTGNPPPTTSITSPANNASFTAGNDITITADASDDVSVTKVEFYEGTNKLGEDASAPYTFIWSNPAAGTYSLTTKAIDGANATGTSSAISITVTGAPAGSAWTLTGNAATDPSIHFLGTTDNKRLVVKTNNIERMTVTADGKLLINTTVAPDAEADLAVNGNIWAKKLKITQSNWADFVFDSTYKLLPLEQVAKFIKQNKHLPDVPSAKEVEKEGLSVGDNQAVLLRKIEELTLYLIEQDKKIKQLEAEVRQLKKQ